MSVVNSSLVKERQAITFPVDQLTGLVWGASLAQKVNWSIPLEIRRINIM